MNQKSNPSPFAAKASYDAGYGSAGTQAAAPAARSAPAPADAAALCFDITEAEFESQVLERSLQVPVLLDCWAPWCGPCRALGPALEKVVQSYGGQVLLAKINTDEAPNISAALRIRSIPLVVLFVGGRPVDQFVGALPEGQIRQFLERHLKGLQAPAEVVTVAQLREEAAAAAAPQEAEAILLEALQMEPGHVEATLDLAEHLIARAALDEAGVLLQAVPEAERKDRHGALGKRIEIARKRPAGDAKALAARIEADAKDFEARFALAAIQMFEGRYQQAFDQLLEVVLRDKAEQRARARTQLVEWFSACPDAEAVNHGRRYLGMYLN